MKLSLPFAADWLATPLPAYALPPLAWAPAPTPPPAVFFVVVFFCFELICSLNI